MHQNLLKETCRVMESNGHSPRDVVFCKTDDAVFDWRTFKEAARDFEYDSGFGLVQVRQDLVIVGEDWWMKRREYDGCEWWEFLTKPEEKDQVIVSKINLKSRGL